MVLCRASLRIVSAPNSLQFHVDPLPYRNGLFWRVPPSCQPVCRSADRGPLCRFVVYLRSCGDGSRGNDLRFVGDAGKGSRSRSRGAVTTGDDFTPCTPSSSSGYSCHCFTLALVEPKKGEGRVEW